MADGLGDRMRLVRNHLDLSASDMAARVGLKERKTWERYEKGETRPNSDVLASMYDQGVDIHWLLSGDGTMLRLALMPTPAAIGGAYSQDDRLYEIAIKATLRWHDKAGLDAAPDALAGMISRAVRMLRSRPDVAGKSDPEIAAEVAHILDLARDMLSAAGWQPKTG